MQEGFDYAAAQKKVNELIEYQMDAHDISRNEAEQELIANTVPVILTDEKQAKRFTDGIINSNSTVREWFESIIEKIRSILKKVYNALKREKSWEQMEVIRSQQKAVDHIADMYFEALESTKGKKANSELQSIAYSAKDAGISEAQKKAYNEFVQNALAGAGNNIDSTFDLAYVSDKLVSDLKSQGADVSGYMHRIRDNDIRHIRNRHGILKEGAYGINTGDILNIPYITSNYSDVRARLKDGKLYGIVYKLDHVDSTYYVEGTAIGKYLEGKQMIKVPKGEVPQAYKDVFGKKRSISEYSDNASNDVPEKYVQDVQQRHASISNIPSSTDNVKYSFKDSAEQNAISRKEAQFDIIQDSNAAHDDYHTWIRSADEIKTLEETLADPEWVEYTEYDPDYTRQMAEAAIESGKITVYSSNKIGNGVFVTPSRMEAESYSANGKIYSKTVNINDVAWIDPTQGQYAPIDSSATTTPDIRFSRKDGAPATAKDVQQLQRRNESLKKQLAIAKQEIKLSGGHMIKPTVIDRLANRLSKEYSSSIDKSDLAAQITELYNYIGDGSNVSADDMQAAAMNVAYNILDKSSTRDNTKYEAGKPVREYLKDTTIKLNDRQIAIAKQFYKKIKDVTEDIMNSYGSDPKFQFLRTPFIIIKYTIAKLYCQSFVIRVYNCMQPS